MSHMTSALEVLNERRSGIKVEEEEFVSALDVLKERRAIEPTAVKESNVFSTPKLGSESIFGIPFRGIGKEETGEWPAAYIHPGFEGGGGEFRGAGVSGEFDTKSFVQRKAEDVLDVLYQTSRGFNDRVTFGFYPYLEKALFGSEGPPPEGAAEYVGHALGSLGGLIAGPYKVGLKFLKPALRYLPKATREMSIGIRLMREALRDSLTLGTGIGLSSIGGATREPTFAEGAEHILEATVSGALTGVVFGAARGLFPAEGLQGGVRLVTGLIGLNALRAMETGGNPFTERPGHEVVFDTLLDAYFLWRGLPRGEFNNLTDRVSDVAKKSYEIHQEEAKLGEITDEVARAARTKVLETEKARLDVEAKKIQEDIEFHTMIKQDLESTGGKIKDIKSGYHKVKLDYDWHVNRAMERIKEVKEEKEITTKETPETLKEKKKAAKAKPKAKPKKPEPEPEPKESAVKDVIVTEEDIAAMEKKFGKGLDEISDDDIEKWIIENKAGEIEKRLKEEAEDLTEVDLQTGTEKPSEITGEESFYRTDRETTQGQAKGFAGSKSVASSMDELINQDSLGAKKDPTTTLWKLINDMNRFLDGESVDPVPVRNFLSEIAANVDRFERFFGSGAELESFKEVATEAADWARGVRKDSTRVTGEVGGGMNLFIDPTKAPQLVRDMFEEFSGTRAGEFVSKTAREIWRRTGFYLNPYDKKWRFELDDSKFKFKAYIDEIREGKLFEEGGDLRLGDLIDYPEFFAAYPDAADIVVRRRSAAFDFFRSTQGWYDSVRKELVIAPHTKDVRGTLLHELQHWVQFREGFAQGGDVNTAIDRASGDTLINLGKKTIDALKRDADNQAVDIDRIKGIVSKLENIPVENKSELSKWIHSYLSRADLERIEFSTWKSKHPGKNFYIDGPGDQYKVRKDEALNEIMKITGNKSHSDAITLAFNIGKTGVYEAIRANKAFISAKEENINNAKRKIDALNNASDVEEVRKLIKDYGRVNFEAYEALAGEIEARDVAARKDFTAGERAVVMPLDTEGFKSEIVIVHYGEGVGRSTLYSGIDPFLIKKLFKRREDKLSIDLSKLPESVRGVVGMAVGYRNAFDKDAKVSKEAHSIPLKEGKKMTAEALWDTKSRLRKALLEGQRKGKLDDSAYKVLQKIINEAGGHGYGQRLFDVARRQVFGGLPDAEKAIVNRLTRGERISDIAKYRTDVTFPKDQSFENTIAYGELFGVLEGLDPKKVADIRKRVEIGFDWMKYLNQVRYEEGLITKEMRDGLNSHNYSMFKGIGQNIKDGKGGDLFTLYDNKEVINLGGRPISVSSSGIESLQRGKATDILETNQELVTLEIFNRVFGGVFRNRTLRQMAEFAEKNPMNDLVMLPKGDAAEGQPGLGDMRRLTKFNYRVDGKRKSLYIDTEFAKGLEAAGGDISPRAIRWSSNFALAPLARKSLTGMAPLWSLFVNLPRDIFHSYWRSGTYEEGKFKNYYNSNPVIAGLQMVRDFKETFYDIFYRNSKKLAPELIKLESGEYKVDLKDKFMKAGERGLLMPFLSTQSRTSATGYKLPGKFAPLEDFMLYIPESLEMWTRLAIAQRKVRIEAKKKGVTTDQEWNNKDTVSEAVFSARDYLDFSQGGWWTKMQDQTGKIYLNAGVQAMRTFLSVFKENPRTAIARLVQSVGIPTILSVAAYRMYAPKTSDDIPEYLHDNNLVIPFPDSMRFKDSTGQEFGLALTIPLDSGQSFFKNLFRSLTEKFMYDTGLTKSEPNYGAIIGSLTKLMPDIMTLPPSQRSFFEYVTNISFWTRKPISDETFSWPKSAEEFDKLETSKLARDVGSVTKLSPDRIESIKRNIIGDNIWTYAVGYGYDKAFGDLPKEMKEEHLALQLAKVPGIKRFIKVIRSGSGDLAKQQSEISEEIEFNKFVNSRNVDFYAKALHWYGMKDARKDALGYIRDTSDSNERDRLLERMEFIRRIKDLPNRDVWSRMWYRSAEEKAADYLYRESIARTPEELTEVRRQMRIVDSAGGYTGPQFYEWLSRLRSEIHKRNSMTTADAIDEFIESQRHPGTISR